MDENQLPDELPDVDDDEQLRDELRNLLRPWLEYIDAQVEQLCTPEYIEAALAEVKAAAAAERARAAAARCRRRPTYLTGWLRPWCPRGRGV